MPFASRGGAQATMESQPATRAVPTLMMAEATSGNFPPGT
jgi:hypothetical protein